MQDSHEIAVAILGKAKRQGVFITTDGKALQVKSPKGKVADPLLLDEVRHNKDVLLDFLKSEEGSLAVKNGNSNSIKPRDKSLQQLPLSFAQERLWFIDSIEGSRHYHIPTILRLQGFLKIDILENALQQIVNRHEILRTTIHIDNGELFQQVSPANEWMMERAILPEGEDWLLNKWIEQYVQTPFDLTKDTLLRVKLVRLCDNEHLLIVVMHHIASDGWSRSVIMEELKELYSAGIEGRPHRLPPIPIQYADYAIWQKEYLQRQVLDKQERYWVEKMSGLQPLNLPADFSRPVNMSNEGGTIEFILDNSVTQALVSFSARQDCTLFMTLMTISQVWLYKHTGQTDICIGTPVANRTSHAVESLIGFFVNTLPIKTHIRPDEKVEDLLQQVRQTMLEAYSHQDMPYEKIVEKVVKERDAVSAQLFRVMLAFQNVPDIPSLELGGVTMKVENFEHGTSKFDLTLDVRQTVSGIVFRAEYSKDIFKESTVLRMIDHFRQLTDAILKDPASLVGSLNMLTNVETEQVTKQFNNTAKSFIRRGVIDLFEQQVALTPDAPAISFNGQTTTYEELNIMANRIAVCLQQHGIGDNCPVPVCIERSVEMVAAIIGILKAGSAYVPVDPFYPAERMAFMLEDVNPAIILTSTGSKNKLSGITSAILISADNICKDAIDGDASFSTGKFDPDRNTYIIYTSGSTGRPKGIEMPDSSLYNLLVWQQSVIKRKKGYRILQFASLNFDASFQEIFLALSFGGTVCLVEEDARLDMPRLFSLLEAVTVSHLFIPYVVLKNISEYAKEAGHYPSCVEEIFTAGEQLKLTPDIALFFEKTGAVLYNYYGPSETHVVTSYEVMTADYSQRLLPPVGKPVSNTAVYILDAFHNPCPIGVYGELYISGVQVAKGYLHRDDLTAERFLANPFSIDKNARMYKSGDICKWMEDGNIEFLGRVDDQVKIRGYRVELAEVESALLKVPGIKQGVVIAMDEPAGGKRLIAYMVGEKELDAENVRQWLGERLPEYMVPSFFIAIPSLPLTNNGKVDKKSLPSIDDTVLAVNEFIAPRNKIEEIIAGIWNEFLPVKQAGVYDNFFRLGGHSLLATRVLSRIKTSLHTHVPVKYFFTHPTIDRIAAFILSAKGKSSSTVKIGERPSQLPLSFAQERLWFIDQLEGSTHYHIPAVLKLKGNADRDLLTNAFQKIINRHEVLRTVIKTDDTGRAFQEIKSPDNWVPQYRLCKNNQPHITDALIKEEISKPFDLTSDYPMRAAFIELPHKEMILVVVLHHIAADGWSLSLLVNELVELYRAASSSGIAELAELPVQYADYACWQQSESQGEVLQEHISYWATQLKDVASLQLPVDFRRPPYQSNKGALIECSIDAATREKLVQISNREDVTLFTTLMAVFNILIHRYTGQSDICIGTSVANRENKELENLVGMFINTVAVRNTITTSLTFPVLLRKVKNVLLEALSHQEAPFEKVVEACGVERDVTRSPLFQVMFEQQHVPVIAALSFDNVEVEVYPIPHTTSKFELLFTVNDTGNGIDMAVEYCTDLFTAATIQRMMGHYRQLLTEVISNPEQPLVSLGMLLPDEKTQLLVEFNDTVVEFPADQTVVSLFEKKAATVPDAIAVTDHYRALTYKQLNERANDIAAYLLAKGSTPGSLVILSMKRSVGLVSAILGVMKCRAAYVPADPAYPLQHILNLVHKTESSFVIADDSFTYTEEVNKLVTVIDINDPAFIGSGKNINPADAVQPGDLAYVLYTSGSTGTPKGAMIEHAGMLNHLYCKINELHIDSNTKLAQTASFTFDISIWQMFAALICGGTTVVYGDEQILNPAALISRIATDRINILELVPSYLALLLDENTNPALPELSCLLVTGEVVKPVVLQKWFAQYPEIKVVNAYGPTEASDDICHHHIYIAPQGDSVPIGKPVQNMHIYIVDAAAGLCPIGVIGEIWVAGIGVGRGYWKDEERTAQSFGKDPFSKGIERRLYRTGDIGRWLADGTIEYYGRKDEQVKINGHRIELGEIENVLMGCDAVHQCAVIAREEAGHKRLVAFVATTGTFNEDSFRSFLQSRLPGYMVPSVFCEIDQLPLLSNGKTDKKTLLEKNIILPGRKSLAVPRTVAEKKLMHIWQTVLKSNDIGTEDNFFESGGDSILSLQLVMKARKEGLNFQLRDIFNHQTIAALAQFLDASPAVNANQGRQYGEVPLLPAQVHFFEQDHKTFAHYNQAVLLNTNKLVSEEWLQAAILAVVEKHDGLRFTYHREKGQWKQVYKDDCPVLLQLHEVMEDDQAAINKHVNAISDTYQAKFDLADGPLFCFVLIKTPGTASHNHLLIILHHLIIDGVSWRILLQDLEQAVTLVSTNVPVSLGSKTISPGEWYKNMAALAASRSWKQETNRLAELLDDIPAFPNSISDTATYKVKETNTSYFNLDEQSTNLLLKEANKAYKTEINELLLAALVKTIGEWNQAPKLLFLLEGHGRESQHITADISATTGWFTSLYPVALTTSHTGIKDLVISVKEQLRSFPLKGMQYGMLRYLHPDKTLREKITLRQPAAVLFNYLGQIDKGSDESKWFSISKEYAGHTNSPENIQPATLVINCSVLDGKLRLSWNYPVELFEEELIQLLGAAYCRHLESVVRHCYSIQESVHTPADFDLTGKVSLAELDAFLQEKQEGKPRQQLISDMYPLSPMQHGMLFHGLYDKTSLAYILQLTCDIKNLDGPAFRDSWNILLQNHSILRTAFYYDRLSIPVQVVYKKAEMPVEWIDFSQLNGLQQDKLQEFLDNDRRKIFNFTEAPLMRLSLVRLSADTHKMVWSFHHLLIDGWSLPVLVNELFRIYGVLLQGNGWTDREQDNYHDYIRYISNRNKEEEEDYWRNYMKPVIKGCLFPFVKGTKDRNKGAGVYRQSLLVIDEQLTERVQQFAQLNHITVNTVVQGVWSYLLSRYTNSNDVLFGVTVSGRPVDLYRAEERAGLYINTLPFRTELNNTESISAFLKRLHEEHTSAREYQYTPISSIQSWQGIRGDLFDSILVFQNYPVDEALAGQQVLQISNIDVGEQNNYVLSLIASLGKRLQVRFKYNSSMLQPAYVDMMHRHFEKVLEQFIKPGDITTATIDLFSAAERNRLLYEWNDTAVKEDSGASVISLFEEQVKRVPGQTAVVFKDVQLSFGELNEKANQLARYLIKRGVAPEVPVPLFMERSAEMVICILAILKAGGAYVPLDTASPLARINDLLEDINYTVLLTDANSFFALPDEAQMVSIDYNRQSQLWEAESTENMAALPSPEQLAYIIYTSGSTGRPKGVMIEHGQLYNYISFAKNNYTTDENKSGTYLHLSVTFDASVTSLFVPIVTGKKLVISSATGIDVFNDPNLRKHAPYDFIKLTPAHLFLLDAVLTETDQELTKCLVIGGEALHENHFSSLKKKMPDVELINEYGPTETTVGCSACRFNPSGTYTVVEGALSIGRPINNCSVYILDANQQLLPAGVPGELYIGGKQVARGYWNQSTLSTEKFVTLPWLAPGQRMYRTGDICCWLPGGELLFTGRADGQLKIKGHRIETGEVENELAKAPGVTQSVILVKEDKHATKRMIAYIQGNETCSSESVNQYLRLKLPEYMIPSLVVLLDSFPLTAHGKIDMEALSSGNQSDRIGPAQTDTPVSAMQKELIQFFEELLEIKGLDVADNLFNVGLDSLKTIEAQSLLNKVYPGKIEIQDLFSHPTIAQIALLVNGSDGEVAEEKQVLIDF